MKKFFALPPECVPDQTCMKRETMNGSCEVISLRLNVQPLVQRGQWDALQEVVNTKGVVDVMLEWHAGLYWVRLAGEHMYMTITMSGGVVSSARLFSTRFFANRIGSTRVHPSGEIDIITAMAPPEDTFVALLPQRTVNMCFMDYLHRVGPVSNGLPETGTGRKLKLSE